MMMTMTMAIGIRMMDDDDDDVSSEFFGKKMPQDIEIARYN